MLAHAWSLTYGAPLQSRLKTKHRLSRKHSHEGAMQFSAQFRVEGIQLLKKALRLVFTLAMQAMSDFHIAQYTFALI